MVCLSPVGYGVQLYIHIHWKKSFSEKTAFSASASKL